MLYFEIGDLVHNPLYKVGKVVRICKKYVHVEYLNGEKKYYFLNGYSTISEYPMILKIDENWIIKEMDKFYNIKKT